MPLSRFYKCIFIHIPKTAGTSIEKILNTSTEADFYSIKPPTLQHLTWAELKDKITLDYSEFYKFTVVRNPFERLVSEYEWRRQNTPQILNTLTFEEVVENLEILNKISHWDRHLSTQSFFLKDTNGSISKEIEIYKYENLEPLWEKLESITKIPKKYYPWSYKTKKNSLLSYYTKDLSKKIREYFHEDFVNFNYE
jgi:chondroitin 4-sulfotransferase 11